MLPNSASVRAFTIPGSNDTRDGLRMLQVLVSKEICVCNGFLGSTIGRVQKDALRLKKFCSVWLLLISRKFFYETLMSEGDSKVTFASFVSSVKPKSQN